MEHASHVHFSRAISLVVFFFGVVSCSAIITGDEFGRVNLIHYILLFCLLPIVSLVTMFVVSLNARQGRHVVVRMILSLPIWPRHWLSNIQQLKQQQLFGPWVTFVGQSIGLYFSLGCLLSFTLVLLFSDISFVWRSTLLNATQVYPWLKTLALPWLFIDSAQPLKETLVQTQELRFSSDMVSSISYGSWWQFLFAAQVCYALIPRSLGTLWTYVSFKRAIKQHMAKVEPRTPLINQAPVAPVLASTMEQRPQLTDYNVVCWLDINETMLAQSIAQFNAPERTYHAGFHGGDEEQAMNDNKFQLVLVAAWEPPLGELKDFLAHGRGIIMPLDFNGDTWQPIPPQYLNEWRRFVQSLEHWDIFVDKELI